MSPGEPRAGPRALGEGLGRRLAAIVALTGFVGAMVGSERSVLPILATREFGRSSHVPALSFLVGFGVSKAVVNLLTGAVVTRIGARRLLLLGWAFGALAPLFLFVTRSLTGLVLANVCLGANQGLCWSITVLLAMGAVPERRRGLAMGWNEAGGYVAMALAAYASGRLSVVTGDRDASAVVSSVACLGGALLSLAVAREAAPGPSAVVPSATALLRALRRAVTDHRLVAINQAGLVNNVKDGVAWGLFPLLYAELGFSLARTSLMVALYPAAWGLSQLVTGGLSDRWGRRPVVVGGLVLQALALAGTATLGHGCVRRASTELAPALAILLGIGTGMVHPTLMAAVGDAVPLDLRAETMGVYRMWRDGGYAVGAVLGGVLADRVGNRGAVGAVAAVLVLSATAFSLGSAGGPLQPATPARA